jgi:hypothetical protein
MHLGPSARPARGRLRPIAFALAVAVGSLFPAQSRAQAPAHVSIQAPAAAEARPNRVDYTIHARVDTDTMRLTGRERVRFENHTDTATQELWFHLYWNAFANNRSTHLTESAGQLRGVKIDSGWGWQRVTSIVVEGAELLPELRYVQPDDGNADDRTVIRVPLARAIEPGQGLEFDVEWEAQIPRVRRRTGYKGDFLFIAQWFPKLGVFEGARGWNCHQFHESTEFYSNFGVYDVSLDLPERFENRIGASGVRVDSPQKVGDRVVTRFVAPGPAEQDKPDATGRRPLVHDFAWTADSKFKRFVGTFHFDAWRERFDTEVAAVSRALGHEKNLRLRNVEVVVLIHPERERQWKRHYEATCAALFFYGLWFGEYPFSQITCVDPAWGANAAGGMEYPTLFTAGTRMWNDPQMHSPEGVTVHEAGHQFFQGLVANNEFEASWMDEGFNSFADSEVMERAWGRERGTTEYSGVPNFGAATVSLPGDGFIDGLLSARKVKLPLVDWSLTPLRKSGYVDWWRDQPKLAFVDSWTDPRWHDRVRYLADPDRDAMDTAAFHYVDRTSYVTNSYPRPAVALRSLIGVVGRDAFLKGMRFYSERWRYRHPYPQDFFDAFCAGAGVDVKWYFEDVFRGRETVDWSVSVKQRKQPALKGWTQENAAAEFVEASKAVDKAAEKNAPWESEVTVVRHGGLRLPLVVELRFEDGAVERVTWTREEQASSAWLALARSGPNKVVAALVDPERHYFLDRDMSNNQWFDALDEVAPWRWTERAFQRFASFLHWQAGIGG